MFDGQPVLPGVRVLELRNNATELVSGGGDGSLRIWDVHSGQLGRQLHEIKLPENGDAGTAYISGLSVHPLTQDMVLGTAGCDVWEIKANASFNPLAPAPPPPLTGEEDLARGQGEPSTSDPDPKRTRRQDTAIMTTQWLVECLLDGHEDDTNGLAFHPLRPHKFATACSNGRVHLWDAKRRQLIAKVFLGHPAECVAFSPDGAHLAVGCGDGFIKVISTDSLRKTVKEVKYAAEAIHELKYSPDGEQRRLNPLHPSSGAETVDHTPFVQAPNWRPAPMTTLSTSLT